MVNWDDAMEKKLLLTVIHIESVNSHNWDKVAAAMGGDLSASAVQQKFAKLKRACKDTFGEVNGGSDAAAGTPKKTPAKRGRKAKGEGEDGPKSGSKRKAKRAASEDGEDDDESSPMKKMKSEKAEDDDENYEV